MRLVDKSEYHDLWLLRDAPDDDEPSEDAQRDAHEDERDERDLERLFR